MDFIWVGKESTLHCSLQNAIQLRRERCMGLRGFHAFAGCDSVSFFTGKGKKDGKHGCHVSQQQMHLLLCLFRMTTFQVTFKHFLKTLHQRCTYAATTGISKVDQLRKHLFCTESKPRRLIPPSSAALFQHCLRAAYQAGPFGADHWICYSVTHRLQILGVEGSTIKPLWSTLSCIWTAYRELESAYEENLLE
ncbi:uncharacterized protein LOC115888164 [Sitophilus oryzae]|uniref:Uncharacterized protein LOC115888164 n=1 Tax=Sitophilus oryzae TaxID=7048 RepID=A0A6J2YL81_SITOR|nr:uncharacterized protein LOC115888164 [Sitophilus oryzae]